MKKRIPYFVTRGTAVVRLFLWCFFYLSPVYCLAFESDPDSIWHDLEEIVIEREAPASTRVLRTGEIDMTPESLATGARVFGEADFINTLKTL